MPIRKGIAMFSVYYKVERLNTEYDSPKIDIRYSEHNQTFGFGVGQVSGVHVVNKLAKKHQVDPSKIVICSVIPDFQTPGDIYWANDL
jgi:hypothetical protein